MNNSRCETYTKIHLPCLCEAYTKIGKPCRNKIRHGDYCHIHQSKTNKFRVDTYSVGDGVKVFKFIEHVRNPKRLHSSIIIHRDYYVDLSKNTVSMLKTLARTMGIKHTDLKKAELVKILTPKIEFY